MPVQASNLELQNGGTTAQLVRFAVNRWPDRVALVGDGVRWTYREMAAQANRLVRFYKSVGLTRGNAVALLSGNSAEVVAAIQAAQILGLRYTALHPLGSEEDHAFVLADGEIDALILDPSRYADRGRALARRVKLSHVLTLGACDFGIDALSAMASFDGSNAQIEARPEDISVLAYTGGTTGRPKGVIQRHRTSVNFITQELAYWEWPQEIRFLVATPLSHAAGAMLIPTLVKGGTFHFQKGFDAENFLTTVEQERITATFLVPTMLYKLLDYPRLNEYDLSSLQMLIYGAAPTSPARLKQALDVFGPILCQLYGQTEAPMTISYLSKADHSLDQTERLGSCGLPIPANQVRLLKEDGHEAEVGEPGEICFRGPIIMEGYWKRPEETEKVFAGGWLRTGDIARRDEDGFLYIVDRSKDMIVTGGFNVFPREIEDCLAQHPAVAMSAVVGVPDEKWGEAVKAVVVLKPGSTVETDELKALVRQHKGSLHTPKIIEIVASLPLTTVGKLDRKAVRAASWVGRDRKVG
ncbi:AMP-binding protein [Bradyrhizobium liaoningense]